MKRFLVISTLVFLQSFGYAKDYVLKVKNNKALVFLSEPDFYDIGDKIFIQDKKGDIVGSAFLLKIRKSKKQGIIKFNGHAKKGYEIFQKYSPQPYPQLHRSVSSMPGLPQNNKRVKGPYDDFKIISTARYVTGGILGIFPGFGVGMAVQGRWLSENGWVHTVLQLGVVVVPVIVLSLINSINGIDAIKKVLLAVGMSVSDKVTTAIGWGILVYVVTIKIWEIADTWVLPSYIKIQSSAIPDVESPSLYSIKDKIHVPSIMFQWQF